MTIRIPTGLVIAAGLATTALLVSILRDEMPGLIRYLKVEGM